MDGTDARVTSELRRQCPFRRMKGEAGPCGQGPAIALRKGLPIWEGRKGAHPVKSIARMLTCGHKRRLPHHRFSFRRLVLVSIRILFSSLVIIKKFFRQGNPEVTDSMSGATGGFQLNNEKIISNIQYSPDLVIAVYIR